MLHTFLTDDWKLSLPIIGAPMSPQAGGALAAAVSNAGGLGMIGVSSRPNPAQLEADVAEYRRLAPERPFGIGLMVWALGAQPALLDVVLRCKPFAVSLSFGDPAPYVARCLDAGVKTLSQVQSRESALRAEAAGVDVLVAQGTEAGGHTGSVGTLPLLQAVLASVKKPVIAAGGIASGRGLAAVLAAGAQGAWIGTPLLVASEARNADAARRRLLEARETETIHTRVFDVAQGIPWPKDFPGRALANTFTARWQGREEALAADAEARSALERARGAEDYDTVFLYAGQSVGLLETIEPAAQILRRIASEAEARLRAVTAGVLS